MIWYTTTKEDDLQGLVIDEQTGANIAVTYDPKDASLIVHRVNIYDELLNALEDATAFVAHYSPNGCTREESNRLDCLGSTTEIVNTCRAAIKRAKGE